MKRVFLMVVNDPKYFLSHRLPIAKAASEKGYLVHIASIESPLAERVCELGFTYHKISLERGGINPIRELFALASFVRLLWRLRPDILHLVTTKPVLYGGIAARVSPVGGVVAAIAGLGSVYIASDLKSKVLSVVMSAMYRVALRSKKIKAIFQNPDDRNMIMKLSGLSADNTVLIRGSGVQLSSYPALCEPEGTVVVTFAGRLLRDKGVNEFIEAARLLREKKVNAVFQLVGDIDVGNPTSLTAAELEALSTGNDVLVEGYQSDVANVFANSHIVVLPSYREGLPKVLIEAAACARPVVTTDVPGCRDAIEPEETGLLVPVRDSVALAEAIERLILDADLRHRMGKAGRALAEREFTIEKVVNMHMDVYQTLE